MAGTNTPDEGEKGPRVKKPDLAVSRDRRYAYPAARARSRSTPVAHERHTGTPRGREQRVTCGIMKKSAYLWKRSLVILVYSRWPRSACVNPVKSGVAASNNPWAVRPAASRPGHGRYGLVTTRCHAQAISSRQQRASAQRDRPVTPPYRALVTEAPLLHTLRSRGSRAGSARTRTQAAAERSG